VKEWQTGAAGVLAMAFALGACSDDITQPVDQTFAFAFDSGLEAWSANATDTDNPPVTWSIDHTMDMGNDDDGAVELTLDNLNDAGKIWVEREFDSLEPNTTYEVTVSFAFATEDYGTINLWRIIAGVTTDAPEDADDLEFQGETGNGEDEDVGYQWLDKTYTFTAETDAAGELWVSVGIWGTFEVVRTYFVDDLQVRFERL
jgi:hypothetical protein